MDGFFLIDKPSGWTSFDVCAKMRKTLNIKKVGHTGTLDPFATGLLVVATGKCTKMIPFLEKEKKTYVTEIALDKTSPTLDPESEVQSVYSQYTPTEEEIQKVLDEKFTGKIEQVPPQFSAIKIKGKKSCDVARKGGEVKLMPRQTEIFSIKILSYTFPVVKLELEVAAGFYVRALARDLGTLLRPEIQGFEGQEAGMCVSLRRTRVGKLSVEDAEGMEHISTPIDPKFIIDLPQREIPTGRVQDFVGGRAFPFSGVDGEKVLVLVGKSTMGVGEMVCGNLQPRVVL